MSYRFFDHTADLGVDLTAASREELFATAARAFTDAITPVEGVAHRETRVLGTTAAALDELLVAWLQELLYVYDVDGFLAASATVEITGSDDALVLRAEVAGERQDPERHPTRVLLKGVTYHRLAVFRSTGGAWRGRVIFDI